jgi:hypothetical protein
LRTASVNSDDDFLDSGISTRNACDILATAVSAAKRL